MKRGFFIGGRVSKDREIVKPEEYADLTLDELAEQINSAHEDVGNSMRYSAVQVVQNGARLIAAKEKCKHGEWLPWLAEKCPEIDNKTAQRYMRTYERSAGNSTIMSNLDSMSPTEAYRALKVIPEKTVSSGDVHVSEGVIEWYTPPEIIAAVREVMGTIDTDPASSDMAQEIVGASVYYTESVDGTSPDNPWEGNVFLNPPYAMPTVKEFSDRAVKAIKSQECEQFIGLTNNATDADWFQSLAHACDLLCFSDGRVKFYNNEGETLAARQGQAFFYWGANEERFIERFSDIGLVLRSVGRVN